MAAVDKCYTHSYEQYMAYRDWAKDKVFKTPRGVEIHLSNWIYDYWEEKDFEERERPIFNTPVYIDNYLYHNCPLEFIQEWLKDRYCGEGWCKGEPIEISKELKLPEYEPCTKVKILRKGYGQKPFQWYNSYSRCKVGCWWIDIDWNDCEDAWDKSLKYNEDLDFWVLPNEEDVWTISSGSSRSSVRAIIRKIIKKWKLPKNCKIKLSGRYVGDDWILITK